MGTFLIGFLFVGCLALVGLFTLTAKSRDVGCLTLLLLAILGVISLITLAQLD